MKDFEMGFFLDKIPYVKSGKGEKKMVILLQTEELHHSIAIKSKAKMQVSIFSKYIPKDYTFFILGYDKDLPPGYSTIEMADDIGSIIKNHIGKASLAAISYGGMIAIPLAANYPEFIEKLILIVTAHSVSEQGVKRAKKMLNLAKHGKFYELFQMSNEIYKRKLVRVFMRKMTQRKKTKLMETMSPSSLFINAYSYWIEHNGENKKYLEKINAPTLIIGADKDQFFTKEIYEETAELIHNAHLKIFENETHMVPIEKMLSVRKEVSKFLGE
ncbi:MAG: alpha/beta fold hydrolase [Candidatus Lokiarchaeota archaeon]|nr:alpha/beta fold hydrolase [Candidatus Lokiarchaeota archaeon]